ncbi:hypothetical protein [Rhodococcus sp. OK302]|uniref:hypothetical protein n=1 Tax=Rhodococcus sp. OK302 TaxID=1882769 RepID=UPI000B943A39|nr:hypothetical protein [Rhodococcus sp. OK302]OYD61187.1 hypothetical protein BDB13_6141 [Rhodococcus sp. OK302]
MMFDPYRGAVPWCAECRIWGWRVTLRSATCAVEYLADTSLVRSWPVILGCNIFDCFSCQLPAMEFGLWLVSVVEVWDQAAEMVATVDPGCEVMTVREKSARYASIPG